MPGARPITSSPIADDTGWPLGWIVGGLSLGLLVAGVVSPRVGDTIQRLGGRLVLATSAVFLALGLIGLALSPSLPIYVASWIVLGIGMGAGLYDAAFAMLGRFFGQQARTAITTLTLFGGFASTVCWPLSAMLVSHFGWRDACLIYAGIHLAVLLPLYVFALPREPKRVADVTAHAAGNSGDRVNRPVRHGERLLFALIALVITISSMISALPGRCSRNRDADQPVPSSDLDEARLDGFRRRRSRSPLDRISDRRGSARVLRMRHRH